jgi:hypothetical protein
MHLRSALGPGDLWRFFGAPIRYLLFLFSIPFFSRPRDADIKRCVAGATGELATIDPKPSHGRDEAMRRLLAGCLGLSLTIAAGGVAAQSVELSSPRPLQPAALARSAEGSSDQAGGIQLGRPEAVPTASARPAEPAPGVVSPTSYNDPQMGTPRPLVRAQIPDSPQPMPSGPPLEANPFVSTVPPPQVAPAPGKADGAKPETLHIMPQMVEPGVPVPGPTGAVVGSPGVVCESSPCPDVCCDDCCGGCGCWWRPFFGRVRNFFCDDECCTCCQPSRWWVSAEYLLWFTRQDQVPALVTTSPAGTPQFFPPPTAGPFTGLRGVPFAGTLGTPGVSTLFGDQGIDYGTRSGGRFTAGVWFDCNQCVGLEGSFFFLSDDSVNFSAASNAAGMPILARPFFDPGLLLLSPNGTAVFTQGNNAELVSFPGVLAGSVNVTSSSRFWGGDLNLRTNLWRGCCWRFDLLTGFRYLQLDESLAISENLTTLAPMGGIPTGTNIFVFDRFGTRDSFYGGQIGGRLELHKGRWGLDFLAKVALGDSHETANINGQTSFAPPGNPITTVQGGLLTQPGLNIGHYTQDQFSVVPEVGLNLSYQWTPHFRTFVGYSFLYWANVWRPGQQIDREVNETFLPGSPVGHTGEARPIFPAHSTDFWAQGINFGFEFKF